ncbi:DUF488 domain-containing protein [Streptomyces sp. NPDC102405]|uniref:DUF488 domain-containing protein n=1 Tax=Streptomyces sp. NPDC102405 TaxID=3366170 RepID=UPI0038298745
MAKQVTCRTVYEQTPVEDGTRVLVDRVWPQDISEEAARLDEWLSTVAPSAALQRSYSQDPLEYAEFRHRYLAELEDPEHRQAANHLRDLAEHTRLTLLTSAADPHGGHVAVLAEWLARADPERSDPPSRGFLARVSSAVADLNAGALPTNWDARPECRGSRKTAEAVCAPLMFRPVETMPVPMTNATATPPLRTPGTRRPPPYGRPVRGGRPSRRRR